MNAKLRALLKDLGDAIGDSVSMSDRVSETMDRIRALGFNAYVNLDARIAIEPADGESGVSTSPERVPAEFRIDVRDLRFLKSVGIDPTRRVRARRARTASVTRSARAGGTVS